jgi:hypothetical protein
LRWIRPVMHFRHLLIVVFRGASRASRWHTRTGRIHLHHHACNMNGLIIGDCLRRPLLLHLLESSSSRPDSTRRGMRVHGASTWMRIMPVWMRIMPVVRLWRIELLMRCWVERRRDVHAGEGGPRKMLGLWLLLVRITLVVVAIFRVFLPLRSFRLIHFIINSEE